MTNKGIVLCHRMRKLLKRISLRWIMAMLRLFTHAVFGTNCVHQLHANEVNNCRATCHEIINSELNFTVVKATAYCCLGESYIFENPLMAEKYILKAVQCLEGISSPKGHKNIILSKRLLLFVY